MSDRFLPHDPVSSKDQIVAELYDRLEICRVTQESILCQDGFDAGVDCRLTNEIEWLEKLLDIIERS